MPAPAAAQNYYNLKAAAWIDYGRRRKPDILLADGFRGLRLYRNKGLRAEPPGQPKIGKWYFAGPFDNSDRRGFDIAYPPEHEIDLGKQYVGKIGEKVAWREGNFHDGQVNNLKLFKQRLQRLLRGLPVPRAGLGRGGRAARFAWAATTP